VTGKKFLRKNLSRSRLQQVQKFTIFALNGNFSPMKKLFFLFLLAFSVHIAFGTTTVIVVSPNGGETWTIGTPATITWATSSPAAVKIELFKDNAFCMTICSLAPATTSSYTWTPPNTLIPASTYKVKITVMSSSTVGGYDFSDNFFTIGSSCLHVLVPNGGEVWHIGTTYLITWADCVAEYARVELWKGGNFFLLLSASTSGPLPWAIPTTVPSGNDYQIKVIGLSASNILNYDFSNGYFSITGVTPGLRGNATSL
jgi:hypothetical protein